MSTLLEFMKALNIPPSLFVGFNILRLLISLKAGFVFVVLRWSEMN